MRYEDRQFKRDYKDLDSENLVDYPLGRKVELLLDRIEDWAKSGIDYMEGEDEAIERMEYTGSMDFFKDIPNIVKEIRDLIKA